MPDHTPTAFAHHADRGRAAQMLAEWRYDAACGPYPSVMGESVRAAKRICSGCPVLADCREWVLERVPESQDPGGVCAGMTEGQRKKARKERGKRARATAQ